MGKSAKTHVVWTETPQEACETSHVITNVSLQLRWFPCLLRVIFSQLNQRAEPDFAIKLTWYAKFQMWSQ